ncbi:RNA pol II accessory factor, Cdc73 family-domain-containing protein [Rhypophila decipiens]|uniref:RNA pol II accessory factor, Cdc73 family-domain-containing protein n=1 Tax=Rhypophila decipiens TaxID=261697 RepID=A0AAN6Y9W2_9PEZI|nr:RNA pol II accessory factor, Cdc73 family-domain-containing protein [Rhypophila decipiens]
MATTQDPLLLMREAIRTNSAMIPTTSADNLDAPVEVPIPQATHLVFSQSPRVALPIDTPTRFVNNENKTIDLRSCFFVWSVRESTFPSYNAAAAKLSEELPGDGSVYSFAWVERLELIAYLEGSSEESEFIKRLPGDKDGAAAASATSTAALKAAPAAGQARSGRGTLDPRLLQIYNGERRMGDRNTVLRGIKPTDFSHVRKLAQLFMARKPSPSATNIANNPALALNQKPQRRPDPIILLSPSASALLRLSNVKSFLENGRYTPTDRSSTASMLHISRLMKDIDPNRPMRFILVEGPEQFRPEYWNRVVAVFTTGQAWQFKNYRWSNPTELFRHVQGIYLGWRGEPAPETVRAFGHRVLSCAVEKWRDPTAPGAEQSRWRDREVVESIWKAIEANMRTKGWRKDAAPTSI